jgi:hypothetical protein
MYVDVFDAGAGALRAYGNRRTQPLVLARLIALHALLASLDSNGNPSLTGKRESPGPRSNGAW